MAFVLKIARITDYKLFILFPAKHFRISYSASRLLFAHWPLVDNKSICDSFAEPVLLELWHLEVTKSVLKLIVGMLQLEFPRNGENRFTIRFSKQFTKIWTILHSSIFASLLLG